MKVPTAMAALHHSSLLLLLLLSLAGACASSTLPQPTAADAAALSEGRDEVALGVLEKGRELTARSCGGCHAVKPPQALPPAKWPAAVEAMRTKQGVVLSDEEAVAIVAYLQGVALRP